MGPDQGLISNFVLLKDADLEPGVLVSPWNPHALLLQGPRGLGAVPGVIYDRLAGFTLVAVPLFILMGEIIFVSGIGADIYVATSRWLNRMPGSLGMSSVAACAIFSALCGVSLAGAATIGSFAIPDFTDHNDVRILPQ